MAKLALKSLSLRIDAQDELIKSLIARIETLESRPATTRKTSTRKGKGDQILNAVEDHGYKLGETSIDARIWAILKDNGLMTRDELLKAVTADMEANDWPTKRSAADVCAPWYSWALRVGIAAEVVDADDKGETSDDEPKMEVVMADDEADRPTVVEEDPEAIADALDAANG